MSTNKDVILSVANPVWRLATRLGTIKTLRRQRRTVNKWDGLQKSVSLDAALRDGVGARHLSEEDLENRVLPSSGEATSHCAELASTQRSLGRPISQFDGMIAAVARLHGAHIATRNIAEFGHCGIDAVNPWSNQ
jgi:hypothetical protein